MTDYKDGDTITVNGKPCRIEGGALVPVVQRGPLGGFIKKLGDCGMDQYVGVLGRASDLIDFLPNAYLVEAHIEPRPTFTPMTAGEAAKLPDIVGRWVAVKVSGLDYSLITYGRCGDYIRKSAQILLIDGVDLP